MTTPNNQVSESYVCVQNEVGDRPNYIKIGYEENEDGFVYPSSEEDEVCDKEDKEVSSEEDCDEEEITNQQMLVSYLQDLGKDGISEDCYKEIVSVLSNYI